MTWNHTWGMPLSGGAWIDPLNLKPEDISVERIAYGLAGQFRYGAQTRPRYTVAEHSVHVSRLVEPEFALPALFHDAAEGLGLPDLPATVKHHPSLISYERFNEQATEVVFQVLGLGPWICPPKPGEGFPEACRLYREEIGRWNRMHREIQRIDRQLCINEARDTLQHDEAFWEDRISTRIGTAVRAFPDLDLTRPWTCEEAEAAFLARYAELKEANEPATA